MTTNISINLPVPSISKEKYIELTGLPEDTVDANQCRRVHTDGDESRADPEQVPEYNCLTMTTRPHNAGFFIPLLRRSRTRPQHFRQHINPTQHT